MVNPPAVDTALTLHFDADVLSDLFQNTQSAPWDVAFDWPSAETVVLDSTAPEVRRVRVVDGYLEIELSEKPDMATVAAAIDVASTASLGSSSLVSAPVDGTDSQEVTWNLAGDDKTLRTFDPLAPGTFILTIGPSLSDLVGTQLAEQFQKSFTTTVTQDDVLVFEEPDEKVTPVSSVDNVLGFHGLPRDLETGFLYVRNRYYDPEIGRFISADPLGYVDGPSMYGFAGYSPMNYGDALGLQSQKKWASSWWDPFGWFGSGEEAKDSPSEKVKVRKWYRPIYIQVEPIKSSTAWEKEEIEFQLREANRILGDQAGVYVFWTRIKKDLDPKGALTAREAQALLERAALGFSFGKGPYEGLPVFYVRETSDNRSEGGSALSPEAPSDRSRAVIVNRFWRGRKTNQFVTAHELGHALGALCDPDGMFHNCGFGAPRPGYGGVMFYPSADPTYQAQGDELSEAEIKRLRKHAQALASNPGGRR